MPKGWEWDPTLFAGSAAYYARGRLAYPKNLPLVMKEAIGLDGTGRLLDIGCGPGTVALDVAHLFEFVVGVDADQEMIAEAIRAAISRGIANATWHCARAEALTMNLGSFRVATLAQSFHWMERERVAALLYTLLEPGGAFVHVDCAPEVAPPIGFDIDIREPDYPKPPFAMIDELVESYLGSVRRAGRGVLLHGTPSGETEVVQGAGFGPPLTAFVGGGNWFIRTADDLVAYAFSNSRSTPHLFGDRLGEFERELRSLLDHHARSGFFAQRAPYVQLRIWRRE